MAEIERLFANFKSDKSQSAAFYDPDQPESYANFLQALMEDCQDYETSILAGDRSAAQLMFYGFSPSLDYTDAAGPYRGEDPTATLGEIINQDKKKDSPSRSTFVSTDVRDAIMLMLPSLIRLFGATESPVYLVPRTEEESDRAEQGTDYVNYVLWKDNPGFLILHGAIKDALTVRTGFVKWWSEDFKEVRSKKFVNVTAEQLQLILSEDPSAKVVEIGKPVQQPKASSAPPGVSPSVPAAGQSGAPSLRLAGPSPGPPLGAMAGAQSPFLPPALTPPPPLRVYEYAIVKFQVSKPLVKIAGVPPEEMRLDRYARSFNESRIVGHERIIPVDQLIAMGVDRDLCLDNIQSAESTFTVEPQLRNPGRFMGSRLGDGCKYGEWYVKIDRDGDGVPELRHICTIGENRQIVTDEDANRIKFALFSCDPRSHTVVGDSLADYMEDIQRIKTNLMRSILDSGAESINPKTVINELTTDVDDAMNDDLGAVIRTRGDVGNAVAFNNIPFLGQQVMPVIDLLNDTASRRTGLTDAAKGLDPKALQSSTQIGVEAVINGAQERVELVARILAETGFKDLFSGVFNEVCENPNVRRTIKVHGKYVPYDTDTFDSSMTVEVNENLGKGSDLTRMIALQGIKQDQQLIVSQMGLNNPFCGPIELHNTQTDMLGIANVKNVGRYFRTPSPQEMQALMSAPKQPTPEAVAAQAMIEKVRTEGAKAVAEQQYNQAKMRSESAFKHQQLHAKTMVDLQKLAIDSQKAGVDRTAKLGALASSLMKDQSDSDAADQDNQLKMAQTQNEVDQGQIQARQAEHDAQIKALTAMSQHQQGMADIASRHTQVMTQMAAQHHQAMTGHAAKNVATIAGALSGDADRQHEVEQKSLDRQHEVETTAATLDSQQKIAKAKPKIRPKTK